MMNRLLRLVFLLLCAAPGVAGPLGATTWHVRADGGTRWSARVPDGQCDGKADAAYPGKGTNKHCAFNDYRFLWDDRSYKNRDWVIGGGDTVILDNSKAWRVGFDQDTPREAWCAGGMTVRTQRSRPERQPNTRAFWAATLRLAAKLMASPTRPR